MYCPKCGAQNADDARFCRGCGAEIARVLAPLQSKAAKPELSLPEKSVALYSRGIRGVLTSIAFLIVSIIMMAGGGEKMWFLIPLTVSMVVMAGAISRFVQSAGYKRLASQQPPNQLPPPREEFLKPASSIYDTDDLASTPFSVTERTTNLLRKMDEDDDLIQPSKR